MWREGLGLPWPGVRGHSQSGQLMQNMSHQTKITSVFSQVLNDPFVGHHFPVLGFAKTQCRHEPRGDGRGQAATAVQSYLPIWEAGETAASDFPAYWTAFAKRDQALVGRRLKGDCNSMIGACSVSVA